MPHPKPQWVFTCAANRTWGWRAMPKGIGDGEAVDSFINLGQATADATKHGFDSFSHYWIARVNGHTTHYRPGKTPLNLPVSEEPKD